MGNCRQFITFFCQKDKKISVHRLLRKNSKIRISVLENRCTALLRVSIDSNTNVTLMAYFFSENINVNNPQMGGKPNLGMGKNCGDLTFYI